jgi:predicted transcriptional regulator
MYLERYLEFLVEQNLVERKAEDGSRVRYKITQKGLVLLGIYGELTHALHVRRTTKESSNTIIMED